MLTFTFLGVIFSGIVLVLVVYRVDYLQRRIKKLENEWSCNRIQQLGRELEAAAGPGPVLDLDKECESRKKEKEYEYGAEQYIRDGLKDSD